MNSSCFKLFRNKNFLIYSNSMYIYVKATIACITNVTYYIYLCMHVHKSSVHLFNIQSFFMIIMPLKGDTHFNQDMHGLCYLYLEIQCSYLLHVTIKTGLPPLIKDIIRTVSRMSAIEGFHGSHT